MGDFVLWLVLLGLLVCSRVVLILVYREQMGMEAGVAELYRCFSTGLRYDVSAATYTVLPLVVLSLVGLFKGMGCCPERVRMGLVALAPSLYFVLLAVDIGYFAEYGDQFDQWIFGLLYDDRSAIWATVWKSYPVVWISILMVVGILGLVCGVRWVVLRGMAFGGRLGNRGSVWVRAVVVVLATGLVVLGIRGSLGRRPVQKKDAATTGDVFLNKMVVNPLYALRYAIDEHRLLQSEKGLEAFLRQSQLRAAAADLFPGAADAPDLDAALGRVVGGGVEVKPKHIFLLVMESYDSWAMQPEYESLFAITGDHYSRRALASRPTLYQRTSVPLVLYGPALGRVARPPALAGSHVDMVPTLVELVAPE
ncbi:MAG: hypothetical protein RI897_569, partial [Verrucomicrobiota bacterium]